MVARAPYEDLRIRLITLEQQVRQAQEDLDILSKVVRDGTSGTPSLVTMAALINSTIGVLRSDLSELQNRVKASNDARLFTRSQLMVALIGLFGSALANLASLAVTLLK